MKNPILQAKCRLLLKEFQDVFDTIKTEIKAELESERINENEAFGYAKKMIRKEAILEGLIAFERKINDHAAE